MVRLDLAFLLCCCKALLGPNSSQTQKEEEEENDLYRILQVETDATTEEIKRAYKRQSLQTHPDKIAQKGKTVTEEDKAKFNRIKEAYEILSDPHKRETYDAIGEQGMKWLEEPFQIDPRVLAKNFASSSILDRSKIFAIFVVFFIALLLVPSLICLQYDGVFGPDAQWSIILIPLWIWNFLMIFYYVRIIMLGPIPKPDDIPEEQWKDPFPMSKRYFALVRFCLILLYEIVLVLKLDHKIDVRWIVLLLPFVLLDTLTLLSKLRLSCMTILTMEQLEDKIGKKLNEDLSEEDKDIMSNFIVIPTTDSLEHQMALAIKRAARRDALKIAFRILFFVFFGSKLDDTLEWDWYLVFAPLWILSILTCLGNVQYVSDLSSQVSALDQQQSSTSSTTTPIVDEENPDATQTNYTSMPEHPQQHNTNMDEQREEKKAQLHLARQYLVTSCCSQIFFILFLSLFAAKLEGATFSSFWLISPLLLCTTAVLFILGCAIYCVVPPDEDGVDEIYPSKDAYVSPEAPVSAHTSGEDKTDTRGLSRVDESQIQDAAVDEKQQSALDTSSRSYVVVPDYLDILPTHDADNHVHNGSRRSLHTEDSNESAVPVGYDYISGHDEFHAQTMTESDDLESAQDNRTLDDIPEIPVTLLQLNESTTDSGALLINKITEPLPPTASDIEDLD